ncbi:MAG: hypothetical protein ACLUSS_08645 [Faecalibacterium sp.]
MQGKPALLPEAGSFGRRGPALLFMEKKAGEGCCNIADFIEKCGSAG